MVLATPVECRAPAVRTLVVQPDALCREGLVRVLQEFSGLCVVRPAATILEAQERIRSAKPNVVVTELDLPVEAGLAFIDSLRELAEPPAVVVLSQTVGWAHVRAALGRGARGYLPRNASTAELEEALLSVLRGRRYVHHALAADLLEAASGIGDHGLTEREYALLLRLNRGETNRELAQALFLSEKTVRNALTRLFHKLRVHNRMAALAVARQHGYI